MVRSSTLPQRHYTAECIGNGLAGTRTQGLRLAKAAIFQLIYEPSSWSRLAHESYGVAVFRFPIDRILVHICVLL